MTEIAPAPRRPVAQITGLLVAFGLSWLVSTLFSAAGVRLKTLGASLAAILSVDWLTTAALLSIVLLWERQSLSSIALRRPKPADVWWAAAYMGLSFTIGPPALVAAVLWWMKRPFGRGKPRPSNRRVALWLCGLVASVAAALLLTDLLDLGQAPDSRGAERIRRLPRPALAALAVTAGVTEEVAFRGYAITRLHALTRRFWLGCVLSYIVFVLYHVPFYGLDYVLRVTAVGSLTFPLLFAHRRSLFACIVLHTAFDALALIR